MSGEIVVSKRTYPQGTRTYIIQQILDHDARPDDYDSTTPERLEAWHRGDWFYIGIAVEIRQQTIAQWADGGPVVGRASLWAIESDSDPMYFTQTENDLIKEAEADIEALIAALVPTPEGK